MLGSSTAQTGCGIKTSTHGVGDVVFNCVTVGRVCPDIDAENAIARAMAAAIFMIFLLFT
jgi:hypothetical protein